ncbi:MAG TPA: 16S rRNA (adenine(1518)-N(6)/adenine(1519)-N(6))-dimethyltransferase RsmA [Verrucomicrobiota bacterium]|nr:16S rRNA (adenine(1518)-N(6)/adenine(1519)-N(6))-dimethyltransferase RsmA [Verrucomicrobiota bacterium]HNU50007.1 16S rRNA (adenine(1518)-N(6)/adenine(1519)-N(6))-dimethyltransferase RsmA [Verrucomicrobiota bacterium]
MRLAEMRQFLANRNIRLTRSLGQNFLHDGNQLHRIVAAAGLSREDNVLEIGPGLGPLTERLLAEAGHVLAIEKDARLETWLAERFRNEPRLELRHADALDALRAQPRDWSSWTVVSNLPYCVASALITEFALATAPPKRLVVTLQLEVARRLAAKPHAGDYGVLTLLVRQRYQLGPWFRIPATCFFPQPDVDSACVRLDRRPDSEQLPDATTRQAFVHVVKRGFSERRKRLFKLLRRDWDEPALEAAFLALGLDADCRAEQLDLHQFQALARRLLTPRSAGAPALPPTP